MGGAACPPARPARESLHPPRTRAVRPATLTRSPLLLSSPLSSTPVHARRCSSSSRLPFHILPLLPLTQKLRLQVARKIWDDFRNSKRRPRNTPSSPNPSSPPCPLSHLFPVLTHFSLLHLSSPLVLVLCPISYLSLPPSSQPPSPHPSTLSPLNQAGGARSLPGTGVPQPPRPQPPSGTGSGTAGGLSGALKTTTTMTTTATTVTRG